MRATARTPARLVVLVWAMVVGTGPYPSSAVLASSLLPDLGLTASWFGLLVFSFAVVFAVASLAGGVSDCLLTGAGLLAVAAIGPPID